MKRVVIFILVILSVNQLFSQAIKFEEVNSQNVQKLIENQSQANTKNLHINTQLGVKNEIIVQNNLKGSLEIMQIGSYNTTFFQNFTPTETDLQIITNGNNNYIDVVGANSLSSEMKIKICGEDKMIFIRNY